MNDDREDRFQSLFWATKHALSQASEMAFSRHGIHQGQQYILLRLWREDGLSPGEVAKQLGIATSTVTRAATRMEAAGVIERRPHPTDQRLVRLVLTAKGRELESAIGEELEHIDRQALEGIGPAERKALLSGLAQVRDNLTVPPLAGAVDRAGAGTQQD